MEKYLLEIVYLTNHYLSNHLDMMSDKYSSNTELFEDISICEFFSKDIYNLLRSYGFGKQEESMEIDN